MRSNTILLAASGLVFMDDVYEFVRVAREEGVSNATLLDRFAMLLKEGRRFTFDAFAVVTWYFDHGSPHMALFLEYAYRQLGETEWERLKGHPFRDDHPIRGVVQCAETRRIAMELRGGRVLFPRMMSLEPVWTPCPRIEEALKMLDEQEKRAA